jgi:hypothetical protein
MVVICQVRFANFWQSQSSNDDFHVWGIQYEEKSVIAMVENTVSQGRGWLANEANWLVRPIGFHDIRNASYFKMENRVRE